MVKTEPEQLKIKNKLIDKKISFFCKKKLLFVAFCCFFIVFGAKKIVFDDFFNKTGLERRPNNSFKSGEKLKYKISYGKRNKKSGGLVVAGNATLTVREVELNNNQFFQLNAFGKTTRFFSFFLKVNHRYESFIHGLTMQTFKSSMDVQEGEFKNSVETIVSEHGAILSSLSNDMLGSLYRLRSTPNYKVQNSDTIFFSYYYNKNIYDSYIAYSGEELIETRLGTLRTIKLLTKLEKGRLFKENTEAIIWITNNSLHIPVKLEIPILVGSIYVNLVSCDSTLYSLNE